MRSSGKLNASTATLRKECELNHVEFADLLGCSQQQVLALEKRRREEPVSALPGLSDVLGVIVQELTGAESQPAKRGPASTLQQQLEQLSQPRRSHQCFVSQMLDTVLQQEEW
jgi:transcriptional regulator with XRE-family HTH domain